MNIFFFSLDPVEAAKMYCDKHVVKIILEIAQMLWTAHHLSREDTATEEKWQSNVPPNLKIYRATHTKHPMCIWVRACRANYAWAVTHALALCSEYTRRYKRTHACEAALRWLSTNQKTLSTSSASDEVILESDTAIYSTDKPEGCTRVPLCMPPDYFYPSVVTSYRAYFNGEKLHFAKWKTGCVPDWVNVE